MPSRPSSLICLAANGMAFVVVQHLSPQHKSMLVELVRTSTSMPVEEAADGVPCSPIMSTSFRRTPRSPFTTASCMW